MQKNKKIMASTLTIGLAIAGLGSSQALANTGNYLATPTPISAPIRTQLIEDANYLLDGGSKTNVSFGVTMKQIWNNGNTINSSSGSWAKKTDPLDKYQRWTAFPRAEELLKSADSNLKSDFSNKPTQWCAWFTRFMLRNTKALAQNPKLAGFQFNKNKAGYVLRLALDNGGTLLYGPTPQDRLSAEPRVDLVNSLQPGDLIGYFYAENSENVQSLLKTAFRYPDNGAIEHIAMVVGSHMTIEGNRGADVNKTAGDQGGYLRLSSSVPSRFNDGTNSASNTKERKETPSGGFWGSREKIGFQGLVIVRPNFK
jgi:hypothetical protein